MPLCPLPNCMILERVTDALLPYVVPVYPGVFVCAVASFKEDVLLVLSGK
jgi:hypothetical protein